MQLNLHQCLILFYLRNQLKLTRAAVSCTALQQGKKVPANWYSCRVIKRFDIANFNETFPLDQEFTQPFPVRWLFLDHSANSKIVKRILEITKNMSIWWPLAMDLCAYADSFNKFVWTDRFALNSCCVFDSFGSTISFICIYSSANQKI